MEKCAVLPNALGDNLPGRSAVQRLLKHLRQARAIFGSDKGQEIVTGHLLHCLISEERQSRPIRQDDFPVQPDQGHQVGGNFHQGAIAFLAGAQGPVRLFQLFGLGRGFGQVNQQAAHQHGQRKDQKNARGQKDQPADDPQERLGLRQSQLQTHVPSDHGIARQKDGGAADAQGDHAPPQVEKQGGHRDKSQEAQPRVHVESAQNQVDRPQEIKEEQPTAGAHRVRQAAQERHQRQPNIKQAVD